MPQLLPPLGQIGQYYVSIMSGRSNKISSMDLVKLSLQGHAAVYAFSDYCL